MVFKERFVDAELDRFTQKKKKIYQKKIGKISGLRFVDAKIDRFKTPFSTSSVHILMLKLIELSIKNNPSTTKKNSSPTRNPSI